MDPEWPRLYAPIFWNAITTALRAEQLLIEQQFCLKCLVLDVLPPFAAKLLPGVKFSLSMCEMLSRVRRNSEPYFFC